MANMNSFNNNQNETEPTENKNNVNEWGQAILRAKNTLIKPYSKYTEEGLRPRTPNDPYTILTKEQESNISRTASPLFFDESRAPTTSGVFRHFRQRHSDTFPTSHLRSSWDIGSRTVFPYVTVEPYTSRLPEKYTGGSANAYPKWYPNRAGERTLEHIQKGESVERYVSIDMFRPPPTARSGQIIFDHGRSNDGYYLPRNGYDTTWFGSNIELNRRHILDSIQPKTIAEYEQEHAKQKERYRKANDKWPYLSEYGDQFVLKTKPERVQPTDLERAKQHIQQNPTGRTSSHNQLAASAVAQGRTLINESSLSVKC